MNIPDRALSYIFLTFSVSAEWKWLRTFSHLLTYIYMLLEQTSLLCICMVRIEEETQSY